EMLARAMTRAGAFEEAVALTRDFQARGVVSAALANCLGVALHAQGKEDEAALAFSKALRLDPSDRHVAGHLVGALLQGGRLDRGQNIAGTPRDGCRDLLCAGPVAGPARAQRRGAPSFRGRSCRRSAGLGLSDGAAGP